jgi:hypothetical protein
MVVLGMETTEMIVRDCGRLVTEIEVFGLSSKVVDYGM